MAGIEIENATVSYLMRKQAGGAKSLERSNIGAQILSGGRYLEIAALRDISLTFKSGDRVGLIGLNGSGKSTLLKLCAGALSVQRGSIRIDGKVSPQFSLGAGIRPTLSGRRNTELKCLYMGTPQRLIGAKVEEIRELSGLGGYFELPVSSYSAGMRSRLVMSMMGLSRGDILIMDEWIGAADPTVNATVANLQRQLVESASILLLASHSHRVLEAWTQKIVWMDQGVVRAVGTTQEIYSEYVAWMESR